MDKAKIFAILIFGFIIGLSKGQTCSSPDITETEFKDTGYTNKEKLKLSYSGDIKKFYMVNTVGIRETRNNEWDQLYIDARLDNDQNLVIFTTQNLKDYIYEQSDTKINLIIDLECKGQGRTLIFRQEIEKTNDYDPEFSQSVYNFEVILPLFKGFDLTYFQNISARDIDLFDNEVTFSSDDSGIIQVGNSNLVSEDKKTFFATLVLQQPLIKINDKLEFTIKAQDKGSPPRSSTAKVIITADNTNTMPPQPRFKKILYQGTLDENRNLKLENVELIRSTWSNKVTFTKFGTDSSLFNIMNVESFVMVHLARPLTDEDLNNKTLFTFGISAAIPDVFEGRTGIVVSLPVDKTVFQFAKSVYKGTIDESMTFTLKEEIGFVDNTIPNELHLDGEDSGLFEVNLTDNKVLLKLKDGIKEELLRDRNYLQFSIIAKFKHDSQATTSVVVDIEILKAPQFAKPLYKGKLTEMNEVATERILFVENSTFDGVELSLIGTDSDLFTIERNGYNLILKPIGRIDDELIKGKKYLECSIVASTKRFKSTATIIIDVESSTECSSTTEFPTIPPSEIPQFEKDVYSFLLNPNFVGKFGSVRASMKNPNIQLDYSLSTTSEHLNSRLQINRKTGDLTITNVVSPGEYVCSVMAKYPATDNVGSARLVLFVRAIHSCANGTTVSKSLLIKHLDEGVEHKDVLNINEIDCTFSIYHQDPNDKEYLRIDTESGKITSIALDREDEVFSQMLVPQIRAELELNCPKQDENENLLKYIDRRKRSVNSIEARDSSSYKSLVLTSDIAYSSKLMILSVIIEDINDNPPEFIYPPKSNFLIGYPTAQVSEDLLPDCLMKIEATDKDAGLNAVVRYKIDPNDHFGIEPTTGIVYPYTTAMKNIDKISLRLYATDRDGASDGNSVSVDVKVKKLKSEHLTLLTFDGRKLENIDKLIDEIKDKTGVDFIVLKKAVIPSQNSGKIDAYARTSNVIRQEDQITTLKAWVYAFNQQDDPIISNEIENKLSAIAEELGVSATSYAKAKSGFLNTDESSPKTSVTGYIVSISLLSVILLGLGTFVVFWYYKHHIKYRRMGHQSTPETSSYNDGTEREIGYKTPVQDFFQAGSNYHRSSIRLNGSTTQETSDEHGEYVISEGNRRRSIVAIADSNDSAEDEDEGTEASPNEKQRTTVTFNELVERIDIESDYGTDQNSISSEIRL